MKKGRKEREMIAFCSYMEKRHEDVCKEVGVGLSDGVDLLGHRFRKRTRRLGVKEKAKRKILKQRVRIILILQAIQIQYMWKGND